MENQLDFEWGKLKEKIRTNFGNKPDLEAILFLIGVRELGTLRDNFTKEEKQDLMHIAVCRVLSEEGYYELAYLDQDGWPHWNAVKEIKHIQLNEQETILKRNIITYFKEMEFI
jgi:hypothetical protein